MLLILSAPRASSQKYFQQEINYVIQVALNDKLHELNAFEQIEYINNSPDTLSFLYFHLCPNGYSGNNTDLAKEIFREKGKEKLFKDDELRGFIDSIDFKADDKQVRWHLLSGHPDICMINLPVALNPGDTLTLTTPFHVKIPKGVTSRMGHVDESYQISQWYPKPAVYDRSGWHQMPYLDQGEFYSEFGSFDVSITLPANYIVGATGDLQTAGEIEMLNKLAADTSWKSNIYYTRNDIPPSSVHLKTIQYKGTRIHDFAWFADKRFHVLKGKLTLPESGREVTTWAIFPNLQAYLWKDAIGYINSAIRHYSKWIGDYPYNCYTAVQGSLTSGEGMEYPGISVIGLSADSYSLDQVIAHEICHNWFYSALGSDERRFPFMDEGITSSYEMRYISERYPDKKLWEEYLKNRKLAKFLHIDKLPVERMAELDWMAQARSGLEQPIDLPAMDFTAVNYSDIIYYKAAQGFTYLRAWLGDSAFDSIMHDYFIAWNSKHPQPEDFRNIFESHSDKDLKWFFNDFLGTTKQIDYKIVKKENQRILLKNKGEMVSPVVISGLGGDSILFEKWFDGFKKAKWINLPDNDYSEIKINPEHVIPEVNYLNNNIRETGLFPKSDPVNAQLLFLMDDPEKRTLIYFPALNWDREDGFMLGVSVNNGTLLPKHLEYNIAPFISFSNRGLAGFGKISYNITPYDKFFRMLTISFNTSDFAAPADRSFLMTKTGLTLYLRNDKMINALDRMIYGNFITTTNLLSLEQSGSVKTSSFIQLGYVFEKTGLLNPFRTTVSLESNTTYLKTSLELNYKVSYRGRSNGLDARIFSGVMINNSGNPFYDFSATGRNGLEEYLCQGSYFDRFSVFPESFFSRQMTISEGGLITPLNDSLGYSRWLISVTFTSNFPGKAGTIVPVKPFLNLLLNDHGLHAGKRSPFFWEAGLKGGLWNFFEIYVPFFVSPNIKSVRENLNSRIRFVFNLGSLYNKNLHSAQGRIF